MSGERIDLSVIIVSWNVRDLLGGCLTSLAEDLARTGFQAEAIVVDNGSTDGTVELLRGQFPWVRLIPLGENAGFARANNRGIAESRGQALLLLNPDTVVLPGALLALWRALHAAPHIGLVGALLLNVDGSVQSAGYRFPGVVQSLCDLFPVHPRLIGSRLNGRFGPGDGLSPFAIDHPLGACMLVRRQVVEEVGGLDERYFYYSEEIDWARRIAAAGWTVLTAPAAKVIHYGGQSTGQVAEASVLQLHRSRVHYFCRWHSPRFVRLLALLARTAAGWATLRALVAPWSAECRQRRTRLHQVAQVYREAPCLHGCE
mgnify:CR=1 FL=1